MKHVQKSLNDEIEVLIAQGAPEQVLQEKIAPKFEAISKLYMNILSTYCKDLPEVKQLLEQAKMQEQMQQQAPMGGGEEVVLPDSTAAVVDTTNINANVQK